jgi:cysteinyl-tRNA synthetase
MALSLYNTLTRRKEVFQSLQPGKVAMYCCGVTVYDYNHLGHARCYIVWDTVRRYFEWRGYSVRYVQNFTDIDDKILTRAKAEGTTMEAVADKYIAAYFEDMDRLNIRRADEYPRATHTLDGIKRLIHELETKGIAYAAEGDVYYSVEKKADYGKLSKRNLDAMEAGASGRVEADPKKHHPFDFALWKSAKPGEPSWESPWGPGRPGWHIECSAMVRDRLGDQIDLHMGGGDLIFPHHENEIAQSEAATGVPLSTYWMHNGMVNVGGEKMSKSLGNFTTVRDLLDRAQIDPMALRLFVLGGQYRKPIDFTDEAITAATNGWATLKAGLLFGPELGETLGWSDHDGLDDGGLDNGGLDNGAIEQFQRFMDDDFNSAGALSVLYELAKSLQREANLLTHQGKTSLDNATLQRQWLTLTQLAEVLGLTALFEQNQPVEGGGLSERDIEQRIGDRAAAKAAKDFQRADAIRDELKQAGITLIDQPGGQSTWHRS